MLNIAMISKLPEDELAHVCEGMSDEDIQSLVAEIEDHKEEQNQIVQSLGQAIAGKRSDAIAYRKSTGIEDQWKLDEEYYEGIIDSETNNNWSSKPVGMADISGDEQGSTIFLNITRPYCDSAGASMADMLLPTDDNAWDMKDTPLPELVSIAAGVLPPYLEEQAAVSEDPDAFRESVTNDAKAMAEQSKEQVKKAQLRIEDWQVEGQYHAQVRKVIEDAARVGSGVIKGPVPEKKRSVAYIDGQLVISEKIIPVSRRISYWNLFAAKGCGENIHDGSYVFERDDISTKRLRDLMGTPGYLDDQIMLALSEGPTEARAGVCSPGDMARDTSGLFEIWYYYGEVEPEDLSAVSYAADHGPDELDEGPVYAQITIVNNRVIKGVLNPLETGDFPYDVMFWQQRKSMPHGIGVSSQIRAPQRMLLGASRNLMNNAGLAGGPMWAFNEEILEPIDGVAGVAPRKGFRLAPGATENDLNKGFTFFSIDMMAPQLQGIISLALKMAEDVTGLPTIMQGQMGSRGGDTLGQTQILNNNANIVRRRIARMFDDLVTVPHITRYYTYLLQHGEDDSEKGDFSVNARGSSALVERSIEKDKLNEFMGMSSNPVFGLDPKKVAKELLRSQKLDPAKFEYDDEEWQNVVANMGQQPADPRIQVAQIREEGQTGRLMSELESKQALQQQDNEFKASIQQAEDEITLAVEEMRHLGKKDVNADTLKVRINEVMQKLMVQRELSVQSLQSASRPIVEPAGRAPDGQSYQY